MSALIGSGELKLLPVMLAPIVGAIIGDVSTFWIGHRSEREILGVWPMSRYPRGGYAEQNLLQSLWHAGRIPCPLRRTGPRLRAADVRRAGDAAVIPYGEHPAILLWASADVLPGALAISALHHYGGLPHHFGKLIWFSAVIVIAAIIGAATWWRYRRRGFNMSATVDKQTG